MADMSGASRRSREETHPLHASLRLGGKMAGTGAGGRSCPSSEVAEDGRLPFPPLAGEGGALAAALPLPFLATFPSSTGSYNAGETAGSDLSHTCLAIGGILRTEAENSISGHHCQFMGILRTQKISSDLDFAIPHTCPGGIHPAAAAAATLSRIRFSASRV